MVVCPPSRADGSLRVLTRGVGHSLEGSVLYSCSCFFSFFGVFGLFVDKVYNVPLQVQGDARDVVGDLLQLLNQFAVAAVINDEYAAAEEDADDEDDPADYPGLFTDNVSCLMLLLPLTNDVCLILWCVLNYFPLLVRAGPDDRHRVWRDRPGHGEDRLLAHAGHEGELLSISIVDFCLFCF